MRVIAGIHRSRKLSMVDDPSTRETKDRVKESMFNMIGPYQVIDHVLDLFAGSGSLGIEAYSRGAKHVVFVDQSKKAINTIIKNTKDLSMEPSIEILLREGLAYLSQSKKQFDLILLDPPYEKVSLEDCLNIIEKQTLLSKDGLIVLLTDQHTKLTNHGTLQIIKQKRITRTNVILMKWGI
jgi:16S rRNA (guanine966-N2)-methyltransferase